MKELVVASGKGGTGKTSVVAALAALAQRCVLADCDVDAADLHLIFQPKVIHREHFTGGSKARIAPDRCTACGKCAELCRFDAIRRDATFHVDATACEGCGVCVDHCPANAIEFVPAVCGEWYVSETRRGPMVHAKLGIAAENSGKLVTLVRRAAQRVACEQGLELVLSDGSPGIGCPVIASFTGASLALFVAEPTVSGLHDFERVAELALQLRIAGMLVVNKADLNPEVAGRLEDLARRYDILPVGRIPYDAAVTAAQLAGKSVVEMPEGPAARATGGVWSAVKERLQLCTSSRMDGLVQINNRDDNRSTLSKRG